MYYIYVLVNRKNQHRYIGRTNNLTRRLAEHNSGKTKSTKAFRPWEISYIEQYSELNEAINREKFLKSGTGREFISRQLENMPM